MDFKKKIWKTGALAVAVTIAFAVFVFRVDDWTNGFDSEYVYAQNCDGWTCHEDHSADCRRQLRWEPDKVFDNDRDL
jgi:hypothetical protein